MGIRKEWIKLEDYMILLPDSKTGPRKIYLSQQAGEVVSDQIIANQKSEFLFPGKGKTGRMINLRKPWQKVCARAGLVGVRLHDLRHTAASIAAGQGASLVVIGKLLGHTQAQTTLRYAHLDHDPALKAANAIGSSLAGLCARSD